MSSFSRRRILQSAASGLGLFAGIAPWAPARSRNHDTDVVVVGAGASGLAATENLRARGHGVRLLEASTRTGGRVLTDTTTFGQPYDRGAHWLHNWKTNSLAAWGHAQGFDIYEAPEEEVTYIGNRAASRDEQDRFERARDAAIKAIGKAGKRGRDVSPAGVVPDAGEWNATVHQSIGPYEIGKDFDRFSCQDWWDSEDGADAYCREGFGTLLMHRVRDIEVELNTPVSRIDWSGDGVEVETDRGRIRAACCVVTVSTGVLAAEGIRFDPALPTAKQEAFQQISMGTYNHLALQFSRNFFGIGADGYLNYQIANGSAGSPAGMSMLVNLHGGSLSFGEVGGEFARELEREGVDGGVDFALAELRRIFGGEVDRHFVKGHATRWGSDPHYLGAYASAEPGGYAGRRELRKPVGDRLFFAGEACDKYESATVHGAWRSGRKAAKRVDKMLA